MKRAQRQRLARVQVKNKAIRQEEYRRAAEAVLQTIDPREGPTRENALKMARLIYHYLDVTPDLQKAWFVELIAVFELTEAEVKE